MAEPAWLLGALQGTPPHLHAFPSATSLDYGGRGMGPALRDAELEAACRQLGPRLLELDLGGAFQLSSGGVARALRACPALRRLAADGSTLQDAAFDVGPPSGAAAAGSSRGADESGAQPSGALAAAAPHPAPLQHLESLSLRGCLFLRGGLLASLAAACPSLACLDLADCALALK
jgi:hypothetical protein